MAHEIVINLKVKGSNKTSTQISKVTAATKKMNQQIVGQQKLHYGQMDMLGRRHQMQALGRDTKYRRTKVALLRKWLTFERAVYAKHYATMTAGPTGFMLFMQRRFLPTMKRIWEIQARRPIGRFLTWLGRGFLDQVRKTLKLAAAMFGAFGLAAGVAINKALKGVLRASQEFEKFEITLTGALGPRKAKQVAEFAEKFAALSPATMEDIRAAVRTISLIPATRAKLLAGTQAEMEKSIEDMTNTILGLSVINPQQGVQGASFALREALGGRMRSLAFRFDVSPSVIAGMVGKTKGELEKDPEEMLKAIDKFVDEFVGSETVAKLGRLPEILLGNVKDAFQQAYRRIGDMGLYDYLKDMLKDTSDRMIDYVQNDFVKEGWALRISDALQRVMSSLGRTGRKVGGSLLAKIFGEKEGSTGTKVSAAITKTLELAADLLDDKIGPWLENNVDTILGTLKLGAQLIVDMVTRLGDLVEGFGGLRQVLKYVGAWWAFGFLKMAAIVDAVTVIVKIFPGLIGMAKYLAGHFAMAGRVIWSGLVKGFERAKMLVNKVAFAITVGLLEAVNWLRNAWTDVVTEIRIAWNWTKRLGLQVQKGVLSQIATQQENNPLWPSEDKGASTWRKVIDIEDQIAELKWEASQLDKQRTKTKIDRGEDLRQLMAGLEKEYDEDRKESLQKIKEETDALSKAIVFFNKRYIKDGWNEWQKSAFATWDYIKKSGTVSAIKVVKAFLEGADKAGIAWDKVAESLKRSGAALETMTLLAQQGKFPRDEAINNWLKEFERGAGSSAPLKGLERAALEMEDAFGKKFKDAIREADKESKIFTRNYELALKTVDAWFTRTKANLDQLIAPEEAYNTLLEKRDRILKTIRESMSSIQNMSLANIINQGGGKGGAAYQKRILERFSSSKVPITGVGVNARSLADKLTGMAGTVDKSTLTMLKREGELDTTPLDRRREILDEIRRIETENVRTVLDAKKWGEEEYIHVKERAAERLAEIDQEYADGMRELTEENALSAEEVWKRVALTIESSFEEHVSDGIFKVMKGDIEGLKDVLDSFVDSMLKMLADLAAKWVLFQAFGPDAGTPAGGAGGNLGGIFGGISSLFGGGGNGGGLFGSIMPGGGAPAPSAGTAVQGVAGMMGQMGGMAGMMGPAGGIVGASAAIGQSAGAAGVPKGVTGAASGLLPMLFQLFAGARGAIITKPTMALIGESGPEVLSPLDQAPGASPLPAGGGGSPSGQLTIVNLSDPEHVLVRAAAKNPNIILNVVHEDMAKDGDTMQMIRRRRR